MGTNNIGSSIYNNRAFKIDDDMGRKTLDSCFNIPIGFDPNDYITAYYKGLGSYYDYYYEVRVHGYKKLLYYKKGSETWGTAANLSITGLRSAGALSLEIFPNPFSNFTEITLKGNQKATIVLSDITGKELINEEFVQTYKLQRNNIPQGIYFYKIIGESGAMKTGKLIIEYGSCVH
jgi:hypothetical protein